MGRVFGCGCQESGMVTEYPMYALEIVDADNQMAVETHYEVSGIYIMDAQVSESQISMKRAIRDTDGIYQDTNDDMLLLNYKDEDTATEFVTTKTSRYQKERILSEFGN